MNNKIGPKTSNNTFQNPRKLQHTSLKLDFLKAHQTLIKNILIELHNIKTHKNLIKNLIMKLQRISIYRSLIGRLRTLQTDPGSSLGASDAHCHVAGRSLCAARPTACLSAAWAGGATGCLQRFKENFFPYTPHHIHIF